ncbi:MAG: RES family NAD+ phosphorylase [Burkholderiales bacterium]
MSGSVTLWRIGVDAPDFEAHELSGTGAEGSGGRWNRAGTPMVYASTTRALACLETMVHLAKHPLPLNRYLVRATAPDAAWSAAIELNPKELAGWDAEPAGKTSLDWGTNWAASGASLLARVPSIMVPEEFNVLVNSAHPAIGTVRAEKVRKWLYDARLMPSVKVSRNSRASRLVRTSSRPTPESPVPPALQAARGIAASRGNTARPE